jgi:aspartate aminotransferase-like enzyme
LRRIDWNAKYRQIAENSLWLRTRLRELDFLLVAPDAHASPAVITIALPSDLSSKAIGGQLKKDGFLLSYQSEYLLKRNWIQICLMGEWSGDVLTTLPDVLARRCAQARRSAAPRLEAVGL